MMLIKLMMANCVVMELSIMWLPVFWDSISTFVGVNPWRVFKTEIWEPGHLQMCSQGGEGYF